MERTPSHMTRLTKLVAYSTGLTGIALILTSVLASETWGWALWLTSFLRDVGLLLSAIMAGTVLYEKLLRDEMLELVDRRLEARIPQSVTLADQVARRTRQEFCDHPPEESGIRLISRYRRGYEGYYRWIHEEEPQELMFAGRSILHRIEASVQSNSAGSVEKVILQKLRQGSQITILFVDPMTDILARLAAEEGQPRRTMLRDLATSVAISRRIADLVEQNRTNLPVKARLTICIYDRVPYFAYHKHKTEKQAEVLVGFYFLTKKGQESAAYKVLDDFTANLFEDHFTALLAGRGCKTLVEFNGATGEVITNAGLFEQLGAFFAGTEQLGKATPI